MDKGTLAATRIGALIDGVGSHPGLHRRDRGSGVASAHEYLSAENRILRAQLKGRLALSDAERAELADIGFRLGRKALAEVATAAQPATILAWYRRLIARKFNGAPARREPGRPPIDRDVEELIVRMAHENRSWGYDRMVGALANLGYEVSPLLSQHSRLV
jgi:putative transposase